MKFDLQGLTVDELRDLMGECVKKINAKKEETRQSLLDKLRDFLEEIRDKGFTLYDENGNPLDFKDLDIDE